MLPFSFSACAKSVLGECNWPPAVGEKGMQLVALRHLAHLWWLSPLVSFTKNLSKGQFGQLWSTKRITEDNGNKPIVLLHKNLALSSKHGRSLMGFPMISLWISYDFGIPFPMRSTTGHPPIQQAATASTCRTTDFKASTFAPEVRGWSDGYPTQPTARTGGSLAVAKVAKKMPMGDQWSLSPLRLCGNPSSANGPGNSFSL